MKRLIFSFCIFLTSICAFSQANNFVATKAMVITENNTFSLPIELYISLDIDNNICIIRSKEQQLIKYKIVEYKEDDKFYIFNCTALDKNNKDILFVINMPKEEDYFYFSVAYDDVIYIYECELIN